MGLLPGELGVFTLGDAGRIFFEGENSDQWHYAAGGGLWIDWVDTYAISVAVAQGDEETLVYFSLGFQF